MKTYFLDQGEFVGGAECFLLDFLATFEASDFRQLRPVLLGGEADRYRQSLPERVEVVDFLFPPVRGNMFKKILACGAILKAAWKLKKITKTEKKVQFFTNTPRTHFVMWVAKRFFGIKGKWVVMFHDFTTPPKIIQLMSPQADILIANSIPTRGFLRDALLEKYYDKIRIVENGVEVEKMPDVAAPKEIKKALVLGRVDPRKGQLYALQAADLLLERNPDVHFSIVGSAVETDGSTQSYAQECQNLVISRGLNNMTFYDEVTDPYRVIAEHDLVLFLATEPETFGRVVVEALSLRRPVIAFEQTGPREILENFYRYLGKNGVAMKTNPFLVESNNAMSLAEQIGYFADKPTEILKTSQVSRDFVSQNYPLSDTKKRLLEILG